MRNRADNTHDTQGKNFDDLHGNEQYNAALYIRLSKEDDNETESQSITNQRNMLREYTSRHGLFVYDEYVDDGFSGGNFDRPAFIRLVKDIEERKVNMVITKDLSRLGRDYIETGHYMEKYFPEKRVRYISLLDNIDTGIESVTNDITPFRAIMNDMYAKDISRKIKSVKHDKQRRGLFIGGKAPYGYKLSPKIKNTLIVDEAAAEIVLYIFRMSLSGRSCREIAVLLNEQNVPPPAVYSNLSTGKSGAYSGLWSSERVAYTLKNRMYTGDMVQGRSRRINYKSKKSIKIPQENWVIVENTHPAIISGADFEKVQTLIESRRSTRKRRYDYPLKGMIFCKECGYPLGVINRKPAGDIPTLYFICRTYQRFTKAGLCTCHCIKVETVTDAVVGHISNLCRQYIDNEGFSEIAKNAYAEAKQHGSPEAHVRKLSAQISGISSNMDILYSDKLNEVVEASDFNRLYAKMKNDRCVLQNKLEYLQKQMESSTKVQIDPKRLIELFISQISENRDLLCELIEKVELSAEKELDIYYRFKIPE